MPSGIWHIGNETVPHPTHSIFSDSPLYLFRFTCTSFCAIVPVLTYSRHVFHRGEDLCCIHCPADSVARG